LRPPFSRPSKLTIETVGFVFWQAQQIATNALLSLAEKVLGIYGLDKNGSTYLF